MADTTTTTTSNDDDGTAVDDSPLSNVPRNLRIEVVYSDDDIIVLNKPCNLRSVPGNRKTTSSEGEETMRSDQYNDDNDKEEDTPAAATSNSVYTKPTVTDKGIETIQQAGRKRPREGEEEQGRRQLHNDNDKVLIDEKTGAGERKSGKNMNKGSGSPSSSKPSLHDAWKQAVKALAQEGVDVDVDHADIVHGKVVHRCLQNLENNESLLASLPRKYKTFRSYVMRNQRKIFSHNVSMLDNNSTLGDGDNNSNSRNDNVLDMCIRVMYRAIETRQRQILKKPEPTSHEESALGQLILLGYATEDEDTTNRQLFTIHRLDCATSGIMVVARTRFAASFLSSLWRKKTTTTSATATSAKDERDDLDQDDGGYIEKKYIARVHNWPPLCDVCVAVAGVEAATSSSAAPVCGRIDLPLAPSDHEPIKWQVVDPSHVNAKPSTTLWRVYTDHKPNDNDNDNVNDTDLITKRNKEAATKAVTLELTPVTGRTHQLRIHCAAMCKGIIGDSLYGDHPICIIDYDRHGGNQQQGHSENESDQHCGHSLPQLLLHAYKLSFPHPRDKRRKMEFIVKPKWM